MLYLSEQDVEALLSVEEVLEALERAHRAQAEGKAENRPRSRPRGPHTILNVLPAAIPGYLGLKAYTAGPGGARFYVLLFAETGELLAFVEADRLGQLRTGAASGLATRYLAPEGVRVLALLGAGYQAETQLAAMLAVRPFEEVRVYSRTPERREAFCHAMEPRLGRPLRPATSAEEAVDGAQVICTITSSREPVLLGRWLAPGVHLNAAGSNWAHRRELDAEAVARARLVVVDDLEQARLESGDLVLAEREGVSVWNRAVPLSAVVAGAARRPHPEAITLFESHGIGLWDVAAAALAYEKAKRLGRGQEVPTGP